MDCFAKIVATLGPASSNEATLMQMIEAGMDVARLNFSHGTQEQHEENIALIRRLSDELNKPISILADLQGPKLRIGKLENDQIEISAGQIIALSSSKNPKTLANGQTFIPFDVPELHEALEPGNRILMDDGNLEIEVTQLDGETIYAKVIIGGVLRSHKGVNLPGSKLSIPILTDKDLSDLEFSLKRGIDLLAVSFVKNAADLIFVRETLKNLCEYRRIPPIIAKLERPEAIDNLDEIFEVCEGVMVARGDLGVEVPPWQVPAIQKQIIREANIRGKMVITATQMLESMINNSRPTRAEAADCANAIYDGTDALMLSGETAIGAYPVKSVRMMNEIILEAEKHLDKWGEKTSIQGASIDDDAVTTSIAARNMADDQDVFAICVFTFSGNSARWVSKAKPTVPIYAFTPRMSTYNWLGICRGVTPFLVKRSDSLEEMLEHIESKLVKVKPKTGGKQVIMVGSFPVGAHASPNLALLHTIKQLKQE